MKNVPRHNHGKKNSLIWRPKLWLERKERTNLNCNDWWLMQVEKNTRFRVRQSSDSKLWLINTQTFQWKKGKIHRLIKQVFFYQWVACGALCIKRKSAQPSYITSQGIRHGTIIPRHTQNRTDSTVLYHTWSVLVNNIRCKHLPSPTTKDCHM